MPTIRPPFVRDAMANAEGLLAVRRPGQAEAVVRQTLASFPDDRGLLELLVRALLHQGRSRGREAIEAADALIASAPDHWAAHYWYSQTYQFVHPTPRMVRAHALPSAERAVELAPRRPAAHLRLAWASLGSAVFFGGDVWRRAAAAADEVISLAPLWSPGYLAAAAIARRRGRRAEARRHSERALELAPTSGEALRTAFESSFRPSVRRRFAARLAFTEPSDDARALVIATHRATPASASATALLVAAGFVGSVEAGFGNLLREPATLLWTVGPVAAVALAASMQLLRRRRLTGWDPVIRTVVLQNERFWRWPRRILVLLLALLPVLWIPASIDGDHAGAWALSWIVGGGIVGLLLRPARANTDP